MPPFPERESSILAILKKKKPGVAEGLPPNAVPKDHSALFNHAVTNNVEVNNATVSILSKYI